MAKTLYNKTLLNKLAKKLGKTEQYTREQISKRAKGYSPEAYFVYWLTKEGIASTVYKRSLSDSVKQEIQNLLQEGQPTVKTSIGTKKQKIQRAEKIFKIKNLSIQEKPPILIKNFIRDAHENAETYQALFIFENSVRSFIITIMEKSHGKKWWDTQYVNKDIKTKVKERLNDEKINPFHGKRGIHEIFYTDFSELSTIIKNNAKIFNPLFSGAKGKTSFLTQKLDELAISRNNIAHTCPLKKKDRDRFLLYFQDWYDQLEAINSNLKISKS